MSEKKAIRIAVVGVGHMGKYHINVLTQIKAVDFVGIFDKDQASVQKLTEEYAIHNFSSLEKCLAATDAVILATPTSTHYRIGKQILETGKHLLVEKPMTNELHQARELIEIAQNKNLKLLVGHVERYNGAVQELGRIISKPHTWESRRVAGNTGRIFDVGVTLDLLIHDIDIAVRVINSDVVSINAHALKVFSDFEDALQCLIKFKNGCLASFMVSRVHHQKERMLRITQSDCDIILDFSTQDISIYREGKSLITTDKESISYRQQSSLERVFIHKENPLRLEVEDFISSIENDAPIDNEMDFKTLEISLEIIDIIKDKL